MSRGILYSTEHIINEHIKIKIPTLREIINNEDKYYSDVAMIVSTPCDMMVQLDSVNIDFTTITDWDLFCLLFNELRKKDLGLIFGDLQLNEFETAINKQNGNVVLLNQKTGAMIDRAIHGQICSFLRKMLGIEKNVKHPANDEAKKFMIERARKLLSRYKKKSDQSHLEDFIIALVNTSEFSYTYESVLDLTIYQFNASLRQIVKKVKFDNLMIGCYAGTINMEKLDQKELNWISN